MPQKSGKAWVDGCYDLFHYGHANGIRQASELGGNVIVGVHSNASIHYNKGMPVMEDHERYEMVRSCRWTSGVVEGSPFVTDMKVVAKHGCSMVLHANDAINDVNGEDCYREAKALNAYREFERTEGISTTDIVGRMLLRRKTAENHEDAFRKYKEALARKFMSSIVLKESKNVVLIDGIFDLFHAGHAYTLKQAKLRGEKVVVGLYTDEDSKKMHGEYPILTFLERKLALLACRYVDEVIKMPSLIMPSFLEKLNVKHLVHGKGKSLDIYENVKDSVDIVMVEHEFSYLTERLIIKRIFNNYEDYMERNARRKS